MTLRKAMMVARRSSRRKLSMSTDFTPLYPAPTGAIMKKMSVSSSSNSSIRRDPPPLLSSHGRFSFSNDYRGGGAIRRMMSSDGGAGATGTTSRDRRQTQADEAKNDDREDSASGIAAEVEAELRKLEETFWSPFTHHQACCSSGDDGPGGGNDDRHSSGGTTGGKNEAKKETNNNKKKTTATCADLQYYNAGPLTFSQVLRHVIPHEYTLAAQSNVAGRPPVTTTITTTNIENSNHGTNDATASSSSVLTTSSSQWCGRRVTSYKDIEDFFLVLLCGFDIEKIEYDGNRNRAGKGTEGEGGAVGAALPQSGWRVGKGFLTIKHSRRFLGWSPPPPAAPSAGKGDAGVRSATAAAAAADTNNEPLFRLPFTFNFAYESRNSNQEQQSPQQQQQKPQQQQQTEKEVTTTTTETETRSCPRYMMTCVDFDIPTLGECLARRGCPPEVLAVLNTPEAISMLTTLRRAGVKPNMITHQALMMGVKTKKKKQSTGAKANASWASALGVL